MLRPPVLFIESELEHDIAIVRIKDNGPGIDPELRSRIFEPNVTTKKEGLSFGLGPGPGGGETPCHPLPRHHLCGAEGTCSLCAFLAEHPPPLIWYRLPGAQFLATLEDEAIR